MLPQNKSTEGRSKITENNLEPDKLNMKQFCLVK